MKRSWAASLGLAMFAACPLSAQVSIPSNDDFKAALLEMACNSSSTSVDQAMREFAEQTCVIYLRGLTDGLFLMRAFTDKGKAGCLPKDSPISNGEARTDFELFFRAHPELAQQSASLVAAFGIVQAHPCPK
jgi:hypothetical protein